MLNRKRCLKMACTGWALILLTLGLNGCLSSNGPQPPPGASAASTDAVAQIREVDLRPRFPQNVRSGGASGPEPQAQIFYGDGSAGFVSAPANARNPSATSPGTDDSSAPTSGGSPATTGTLPRSADRDADAKGYEMNFENAPVATIAKVILGDILHAGYTIDARVGGTVTLASGGPVPRKDLLYVLESALRVSNVALVRDGEAYRLIPAAEAPGGGTIDAASGVAPGYGITAVPLQFVSATVLAQLLDNFAAKPGMIRADPARNLIVIQGNAADRQAAVDTLRDFDADWMHGQSVGIFPVSNSTPEPVIAELERIIDGGEGGLSQNLVKLQPIGRENAILAVTKKPNLLKQIGAWIARLDKTGTAGTGARVYRMRYGNARQVAGLLNAIFTGDGGSGVESPSNELVPGGGAMVSHSPPPTLGNPATSVNQQLGLGNMPAMSNQGGGVGSGRQFATNADLAAPTTPGGGLGGAGSAAGGGSPILHGVRIAADAVNNALVIYSNLENYRIIESTLRQLDRPQLQVAIDATIAEVTLNDELNYGVQIFLQSKNLGLKPDTGSITNNPIVGATTAALSRVLPGFNFLVGSEANPKAILDALHEVTTVKVLSTPSIVVVDNQPATLLVGDQIPVTTQTAVSVVTPGAPIVNNIDYRNTGVILHVTPRINANGNVLLNVEQEISNVDDNANALTLTPTVSQRVVRSSIAVTSGQTVLLAGLISETKNGKALGIPGLDQIPGLGILFSQNNHTIARSEIIIFIRPQIIRNGVDAQRIAEQLRAKILGLPPTPPVLIK